MFSLFGSLLFLEVLVSRWSAASAPAAVFLSELAPSAALGAAPVLAFLCPFVLRGLSVCGSPEAEFGLAVSGPVELLAEALAGVASGFGSGVAVGPLELLVP